MRFAVGLNQQGKSDHVIVDAEDALVAALKVKLQRQEAMITYVPTEEEAQRVVL